MSKNLFFLSTSVVVNLVFALMANTGYGAQPSLQNAVKSVLSDIQITNVAPGKKYQADFSYLVADIKYLNGEIKICEFGPGRYATMPMSEVIYDGQPTQITCPYWPIFWAYCSQLPLPIWYIGETGKKTENCEMADVHIFDTLDAFQKSNDFIQRKELAQRKNPQINTAYTGILVYAHRDVFTSQPAREALNNFQIHNPDILMLDKASNVWANNKYLLAKLLNHPDLKAFKPRWNGYKKEYTPDLAKTILNDLQCDTVVIKPTNASLAHGVIVVDAADLDNALQQLFTPPSPEKAARNLCLPADRAAFDYWHYDRNGIFMAEAFEKSKLIKVLDEWYDPTMRIVFILQHDAGKIYTSYLGGFWKAPAKSLSDPTATLTEKHKTLLLSPEKTATHIGIKVEEEDLGPLKKALYNALPRIYEQMLIPIPTPNTTTPVPNIPAA